MDLSQSDLSKKFYEALENHVTMKSVLTMLEQRLADVEQKHQILQQRMEKLENLVKTLSNSPGNKSQEPGPMLGLEWQYSDVKI